VGFYFIAFALAFPRRRWRWLGLGLGLGAAIGLVRILQGGHFLSDVVFSGVVNAMVFVLLYWVLLALWPAGRGGRRTG
jgi:lipid A 4'-phosphatase